MVNFTPVSAGIGGTLIGVAASLLWIGLGRIAGVSGIIGNLATAKREDVWWRIAFVVGLMAAPVLYRIAGGIVPPIEIAVPPLIVAAGGLLVGIGTRLGSGCTSGHGVCGLARLSLRSVAATGLFMGTGVVTASVLRHLIGS